MATTLVSTIKSAQNFSEKDISKLISKDLQMVWDNLQTTKSKLVKQTEIDFGNTIYQTQRIFNIQDSDVPIGSKIIACLSYDAPTGKSQDELEMDEILLKCSSYSGGFNMIATSLYGSVAGKFYVNYTINY